MRLFVTGGAGFIGSAAALHFLELGHEVVICDALTYAAAPGTVELLERQPGCTLVRADLREREELRRAMFAARPDAVVNLAAETHVDRSIDHAGNFIDTNIVGAFNLLEAARAWRDSLGPEQGRDLRILHVSTDEVFGELGPEGHFDEASAYAPNSPYAASKAGSDHLMRAWARTYGLDVRISNCSNNYGPRQFPEKLIPLMILNALEGRALPVYGDGRQVRDWLHVEDHVRALALVLERGRPGETYCIGGDAERANIEVVQAICGILEDLRPAGSRYSDLVAYVKDRPGHDRRYAIDAGKIRRELGWSPSYGFEAGLRATVAWYLENENWWRPLAGRYDRRRLGAGGEDA